MTTLLTVGQDSSTTNALYRKRIVKIPFVQQVNMAPKMSLTAVNANGTRTLVIRAPLLRFGLNGAAVSQATATTNSSAVTSSNAATSPAIVARPTTSLVIRRPMNLIPHFQRPPTLHPVIQQQQQQPSATAATSSNNIVTIRSASNVVFNNNNISSNERPNNALPVQSAPSVVTLKMPSGFRIRPTPIVQHRMPKPSALNASVYANYTYVQQGNTRPPSSVRKVMRHRNPTPSPSPPQEGVPNNICTVNRQHRYRNPTPSPSPPQDSNESSYLLRKAYIRNPTPPPSPERSKKVVMSQQFGMHRLSFPNGSLLTLHKAPSMNLHNTAAASAVDVEHLPIMSSSFDVETSVDLNARNCEDVEECVDGDEQDIAFVADMNEEDESASSRQSSSQADDSSGTPGVNFFDDLTPYEDIFNSCSNLSDSGQQPQQAIGLKTAYGKQQPMLEELEKFALEFKRKRIKLGFTQCDVSVAIGKMYDVDYSQTTVSRFEALNLSFRNMCRLKPLLERWLIDTETAIKKGMFEEKLINHLAVKDESSLTKRRKKRTIIEGTIKRFLEAMYQKQRKPSLELIDEVAASLNFTSETIRTWFCNRRQRDQRSMPPKSPLQPMDDDELGDDEEVAQHHYSRQGRGVSFAVEDNSSSRSSAVVRNRSSATYASSNNKNGLNSSSSSSAVRREDDDDRFDKTPSPRRDDDGDDLDEMMIAPLLSSSSRQHSSVVVSTSSPAGASTTRQAVLLVRDSASSSSSHHFDDEQQLDFHDNSDEDGDDVNGSFLED